MSQITEDIKSRIDIVDLISEYMPLTQAGSNFRGLCPFHREKTPSFMVSPDKQIFHCFGCSASGDIFEFIKKIESVEFGDALRVLADKANVKIDYNYNPDLSNKKTRILDILKESVDYYHDKLFQSDDAKIARDYLAKREIEKETSDLFGLGYSSEAWDDLYNHLKSKKFEDADIESAGMIIKSDKGYKFYDRFRGRLMFPISNAFGQVVGFTARILTSDQTQAKYINSPQTMVYDKSNILYNIDLAKNEIKSKGYTILVEGNIDAISSYVSGAKNVVATSGTALTIEQVKLLKRYSSNLMIAYDGDSAGLKATFRIIDNALSQSMNVKIISLPKDIDPDNLIKEDKAKWFEAIKNAKPIMDFVFSKVLSSINFSDIFAKKLAIQKLLAFIAKFRDEIERESYLKKLSEIVDIDYQMLKSKVNEVLSKNIQKEDTKVAFKAYSPIEKDKKLEFLKKICALGIGFSNILDYLASNLEGEFIGSDDIGDLYKSIIIYYTKNNSFDLDFFRNEFFDDKNSILNTVIFLFENEYSDYDRNSAFIEIQQLVKDYKKLFLNDRMKSLEQELKQAELAGDNDKIENISNEFTFISKQLKNLS